MSVFTDILKNILKPATSTASKPVKFSKNQNTIDRAINILRAARVAEDGEFAARVDSVVAALNAYAKIDSASKTKKDPKPAAEKKTASAKPTTGKTDKKAEPAVAKAESAAKPKAAKTKKAKPSTVKAKTEKASVAASKKSAKPVKSAVNASEAAPIAAPDTTPSK